MALNIADLIEHAIDVVPERTALIDERRSLGYAELEAEANRLAHWFAAQDIETGDHVGILCANSVDHVVALVALLKIRAVPINLNYRYTAGELEYVVRDAELVGIVFEERLGSLVEEVVTDRVAVRLRLPNALPDDAPSKPVGTSLAEALEGQSAERDFGERSPDDHYIIFTGGTTGYPKGVVWRHEDIWRTLGGGIDYRTHEYQDEYAQSKKAAAGGMVAFPLSPMMHGAGVWSTMSHLFVGDTTVLRARFDPDQTWRAVAEHGVQGLFVTGDAMARPLIEVYEAGDYDASSLVAVASSAAMFSHAVKQRWMAAFPKAFFSDAFGSTESGLLASGAQTPEGAGGPTGRLGPETVIFDESLNLIDPDTSVGEIGIMGRRCHVPLGYWKDPAKSAGTFFERDGERYVVAGDYVRIEADRHLTLLGRGSGTINTGGEKVFPEEVEGALKAHPAIWDALVVGMPDERWGERVSALVQARDGETPELTEVQDFLRSRVADFKLPRMMLVVDKLPRHETGKANYPQARKLLAAAE
ncbi:acyl-CoA synthetase [Enemella sp. A6]|uniref:acyl-CoA synthetase n=1 Tax=Enemella sp. A6 TaxID=3440152 RepID=UPI003EC11D2C